MLGGQLVVIKRSGRDGMRYPLPAGCVTLGRDADCHIRVLLPTVSRLHATVTVHRNQSVITNESPTGVTLVNDAPVSIRALAHNDVITLGDRSLRWEYYRPGEVRAGSADMPHLESKPGRRGKKKAPGRASEVTTRRLEPEVKALLEMRHRASVPGTRVERQVAIVQPQRRGESSAEPAEVKTKAAPKPTGKRTSRGAKSRPSNEPRKSNRSANNSSVNNESSANTSRTASPKKTAKKAQTAKTDEGAHVTLNADDKQASPKRTMPKKDEKVQKTPLKTPAKKIMPTPKKSTRKASLVVKKSPKLATPKNRSPKVATPKQPAPKVATPTKTPRAVTSKSQSTKVTTPRLLSSNVELPTKTHTAAAQKPQTPKVTTPKPKTPKAVTPKTPKLATPKLNAQKPGLDLSKVEPIDLAAVAARGTPRRATPKGPFVHVATPRPKTPYIDPSPSRQTSRVLRATATPRVNPLLRAATTAKMTPSMAKKLATPKSASARKKNVVEKIEEPTSIDAQKKSALMALTGRSPMKAAITTPKLSPKFIITKASIKKISPSSSRKSGGKRRKVTATPKLRPGTPRGEGRRYKSGTPGEIGAGDGSIASAIRSSAKKTVEQSQRTPTKRTSEMRTPPLSRSPRSTNNFTPPIITTSSPTPIKSALKSPLKNSPRKTESIKFDLSNLKRRSASPPVQQGVISSPKMQPKRGRSSVTNVDTTSEEDLMLVFSDESSSSDSPRPKRSKSKDTTSNRSPSTSKLGSVSQRKSSRGSFLVQKVLDTPIPPSPTSSDQSLRSSYSRRSTLTTSRINASSVTQMSKHANKTTTPTALRSARKTMESYSIVDLVSIDTSRVMTDTSTDYDSASSVNSSYRTPNIRSAKQSPTSRGKSLANLSLETSTPMNRGRLSARKALLKSATIASAIKRSQSTPAAKKLSPAAKTPSRRSKSLTLSPKDDTQRKSKRSEIIIDDSAMSNDSTVTPRTRTSISTANSTTTPSLGSAKSTPAKSPNISRKRGSKSLEDSLLRSPGATLPLNISSESPSPSTSKSSGRSSRSALTLVNTSKVVTPKNSSRRSSGTPGSKRQSTSLNDTSNSSIHKAGQSPSPAASRSSGRSSRSAPSPANTKKVSTPKNSSRKLIQTPRSKRRSTSLNIMSSSSKRRSSSRGSLASPKLQITRPSAVEDPSTPENETTPSEAGTPVLNIQSFLNESHNASKKKTPSVKDAVKRFEALATPQTAQQLRKVTRKTLGGIGERILARRSDLGVQSERKAYSETRKGRGISKRKADSKINLSSIKKVLTRRKGRNSDENSVASDKTDENAPKPDNEIVITPKSSIQLVPEAVKDKHSTAKKSLSRKSIIDHLNESQEIVKQLFNSPVKRKLSQSISNYSKSINESSTSRGSNSRRSTRTPNVSFDFDNVKTPHVPIEAFVSPMDTPIPPSPNLVGVKRLYSRNTPNNDLRNVMGVKTLLKTPGAKKSPRNDLTNVSGVKDLLKSTRKGKSPQNDLAHVSGVKKLFESSRKPRSPKNDLTQVAGVKALFASVSRKQKSPRNDLRNVAGVKKLMATPKGKQKSPKNDLTNVTGVRSVFRRDKSIVNALNDISGIGELFSQSTSTVAENTISDFDKLVGRTPLKSYGRSKSVAAKKSPPTNRRSNKSLDLEVSHGNVEEWLNKEIEKRTTKSATKRPSKVLEKSTSKSPKKTPKQSVDVAVPKSARVERALKKLTIDAVGGDVTFTPGRSRRTITADRSIFSIEVAKALTPPKKKTSPSQASGDLKSLPLKKRAISSVKKTPKSANKPQVKLDDSAEALGLNKERPSLPLKKRMIDHKALGHSTPVKKRVSTAVDDAVSELGPVSPIESSPNVTPRKSISLQEARKTVARASASIRSAQKSAKNISIQTGSPRPVDTKKTPAKGRKGKEQEPAISSTLSPAKPVTKTRAKRGVKNVTASPKSSPKKQTRGRKSKDTKVEAVKIVVGKKAPKMSPQKPATKATRGKKAATVVEETPEKPAPRGRGRKALNASVEKSKPKRASLVIAKNPPKMSPQKPAGKLTRGRKAAQESSPKKSPVKSASKGRGRKVASLNVSPKKLSPKKPVAKNASPKKATAKKAAQNKPSAKDTSPVKASPRKTRGKKSSTSESSSSSVSPVRGRKKAVKIVEVVSPAKPVKAGAKRKADTKVASPKAKKTPTSKKHVTFASSPELEQAALTRRGGRRKADVSEEEPSKPQAKRTRGKAAATVTPASPARRGRPAKPASPVKPRSTRQRK